MLLSRCEPDPILPIRIHHCTPYQPFAFIPIATRLFSAARPNPLTSLAIVIPDSFSAHHFRPTHLSAWRERTLQSSISFLSFSAPAHLLSGVQILTVRQSPQDQQSR